MVTATTCAAPTAAEVFLEKLAEVREAARALFDAIDRHEVKAHHANDVMQDLWAFERMAGWVESLVGDFVL